MKTMNALARMLFLPAMVALSACSSEPQTANGGAMSPPMAEKREHVVEAPAGDRVDPYYWMRDDRRNDPDVLAWLETARAGNERFDVIFLDPPSFSNSKAMTDTLDIQRDHPALIEACMALLSAEGILLFSNNRKGFTLQPVVENRFQVDDLSRKTLPKDFARTPERRYVCEIRKR